MRCFIEYNLQNDLEKINKKDIKAIYNGNKLSFIDEKDSIKLTINKDNIVMIKENDESLLEFNFKLKKKNEMKYYIKQINSYINAYCKTNKLDIDEKGFMVEYEIFIEEESIGNFKYEVIIKEM